MIFPSFILIWPTPFISIWQSSIGLFLDFLLDYFRTLSYWYDPRPKLSYRNDRTLVLIWGEGKEIFYPLLSLNPTVIFLVIGTGKFEGHLLKMRVIFTSDMTVHFGHRKYSQWDSKSAPKNSQSFIISIGQTICKENIIEVNLERIIPPEKDSRLTYYRLEQCFPWIWTVLSTKCIDFNNKSIRGTLCFKNVPRPIFASKTSSFSFIGDIPYKCGFCSIGDIPYSVIGDIPVALRQYPR